MGKRARNGRRTVERLHVGLLVDESGSMAPLRDAVIAGLNEFIAELKADPGHDETEVLASLAMFDLRGNAKPVRVRFAGLPLARVKPLGPSDYQPHGMTPLNDAVAQTVGAIANKARHDDRVMIVILTDGLENASETSTGDVRKLILESEAKGWEFIYLGANQDVWAESGKIGLAETGKSFAWDASAEGVGAALSASGDRVRRFRDAPREYRRELAGLSDRIEPGERKVQRRR